MGSSSDRASRRRRSPTSTADCGRCLLFQSRPRASHFRWSLAGRAVVGMSVCSRAASEIAAQSLMVPPIGRLFTFLMGLQVGWLVGSSSLAERSSAGYARLESIAGQPTRVSEGYLRLAALFRRTFGGLNLREPDIERALIILIQTLATTTTTRVRFRRAQKQISREDAASALELPAAPATRRAAKK